MRWNSDWMEKAAVRLGKSRGRKALFVDRRRGAASGRRILSAIFHQPGMADAPSAHDHRHYCGSRSFDPVRTESCTQISGHSQCHGCLRHRHPFLNFLRGARSLGPYHPCRRIWSYGAGNGGRRPALDPARFNIHRTPRPCGRLCHPGAAFDGRKPAHGFFLARFC